ncbi:hypothetical protein PS2_022770 [Malus domestica]
MEINQAIFIDFEQIRHQPRNVQPLEAQHEACIRKACMRIGVVVLRPYNNGDLRFKKTDLGVLKVIEISRGDGD